MNNQQNMNLLKKLFDEVYTKGNISALAEFCTAKIKLHDPAVPNFKGGIEELKAREMMYKTAFPDKQLKIEEFLMAGDDKAVVRWTCKGTHKGELQGVAPTNKSFQITGISIYRFENGKIAEIFQNWDRLGLLEQIGEIHPAAVLHR